MQELEGLAGRRYVSPYWLGLVHAGLGDQLRALDMLDRAYQERDTWLAWLKVEPRWDALRALLRFQELLHRMGFETGA